MSTLDSIIKDLAKLTPAERTHLLEVVQSCLREGYREDDESVGQRGLASWTISTVNEDWSEFYPSDLPGTSIGGAT